MKLFFSDTQQKSIGSVWIAGIIIAFLYCSNYFVDNYGPDNTFYSYLWEATNWFLHSLVFAWYFYANQKIAKGIVLQLLFAPYYIFKTDWAAYLDYHLDFDNSLLLYQAIRFGTFMLPLLYFTVSYFKNEAPLAIKSKVKRFLAQFFLVLVLMYAIDSDPDSIYKYVTSESLYLKDTIVSLIFLLISYKTVAALVGFLYFSNRIYAFKKVINPIDEQAIPSHFFKWGFIVCYPILMFTFFDMGTSVFTISFSFSGLKITAVIYLVFSLVVLLLGGRFFGSLIQYRNYTLKKYFGVINSLSLLPVFNLLPFLVLLLSAKSSQAMSTYISSLKKKRNIHLLIYCTLLLLYTLYQYFKMDAEIRDFSVFYKLGVYIVAIVLVSRFKVATKIVPFLVLLVLNYSDVKEFFDFAKGFLFFFKEKIATFLWLGTVAVFLLYYILYYVLHKSFYTPYFERKNEEEFETYIEKFQEG